MQLHGSELKKGVVIERGASPWQIFQQNEQGFAVIRLSGTAHRVRQSFELPLEFSAVPEGSITVKARIALESSGESVCPWTVCRTDAAGRWSVTFDRVPAGGLYRVETYMEYQGWDGLSSTRGDMIHIHDEAHRVQMQEIRQPRDDQHRDHGLGDPGGAGCLDQRKNFIYQKRDYGDIQIV